VGQLTSPAHAVLWQNGTTLDLGTLYGGVSTAVGINNEGLVVGQAGAHAFVWSATAGMHDLGTLDGLTGGTAGATAINDRGQIVGFSYSYHLGTTHAVAFTHQGVIDLGTPGGESEAHALNNLGQVVGSSQGGAFLTDLNGGPMVNLNTLIPPESGWTLGTADGINDAGQIVGTGQLPGNNIVHAYLLTPQDNSVIALGNAAPGTAAVRAQATDGGDPMGQVVAPRPLPQEVENGDVPLAWSTANVVPRAFAGLVAPPTTAEVFSDPLAVVLIQES
jgi:probable HAF family extracellular repeat protein